MHFVLDKQKYINEDINQNQVGSIGQLRKNKCMIQLS